MSVVITTRPDCHPCVLYFYFTGFNFMLHMQTFCRRIHFRCNFYSEMEMVDCDVLLSSCGSCGFHSSSYIVIPASRLGPSSWLTHVQWYWQNYASWFSVVSSFSSVPAVTIVPFTRVPSSDTATCWSGTCSRYLYPGNLTYSTCFQCSAIQSSTVQVTGWSPGC